MPSVFATTRKLIATNRELVMRVARGFIQTVHAFKTQPEVYIPVLQRFLALSAEGLQSIRDTFSKTYPAARKVQEADFTDSSIVDELERSGFIAKLYAGTTK